MEISPEVLEKVRYFLKELKESADEYKRICTPDMEMDSFAQIRIRQIEALLTTLQAATDAGEDKYQQLQSMLKNMGAGYIEDPIEMMKWIKLAYENWARHATGVKSAQPKVEEIGIEELEQVVNAAIDNEVAFTPIGQRHATMCIIADKYPNGLRVVREKGE